jgi:hypothetical protein
MQQEVSGIIPDPTIQFPEHLAMTFQVLTVQPVTLPRALQNEQPGRIICEG